MTNPSKTYTYVAKVEPDYFHGRSYLITFPDLSSSSNQFYDAPNLRQVPEVAKDLLIEHLVAVLMRHRAFPKPAYRQRTDLKKVRQFPITVSREDLEKRIREISAQKRK